MPGNILPTSTESVEMPVKVALRTTMSEQEKRILEKQSNPDKLKALGLAHLKRMKDAVLNSVTKKPLINTLEKSDDADDSEFTLGEDDHRVVKKSPSPEEIEGPGSLSPANGGAGRSPEDPMRYIVTPASRFFCSPTPLSSKPTEKTADIEITDLSPTPDKKTTAELVTARINEASKMARFGKLERQKIANEAKKTLKKTLSKEALLKHQVTPFAGRISFDGENFILENFVASHKSGLGILSVFGFIDGEEEEGEVYLNKFSHLKIILEEISETWPAFSLKIDEDFEEVLEAATTIDLIGPHLVISADKKGIRNLYHLVREKVEDTYSSSIHAVNVHKSLSPKQKIHMSENLKKAFESISLTLDEFETAALDYLKLFNRLAVPAEPGKVQSLIDALNSDSESDSDPWLRISSSPF